MISITELASRTKEITIKTPDGDTVCLTVNLNKITPAERGRIFNDDDPDILRQVRDFLVAVITGWDIKMTEKDEEPAPITGETLELLPDRLCVIFYEKIMEASSKLVGELIS